MLMDKQIAQKILGNIVEEYEMVSDMSITENLLDYLKDLMKVEHKLNKVIKGEAYDEDDNVQSIAKHTEIDNYLADAWDEFVSYKTYKEQYKRTRQDDDLQMAHDELGHFLNNVNDVYRELAKICQDDMEECSMVKAKVKEVYQMFH